jgi:chromatin remodeling complex protein RSC6
MSSEQVEHEQVVVETETSVASMISELHDKIQLISNESKALQVLFKKLSKEVSKIEKSNKIVGGKKKNASTKSTRAPSGFAKPTNLTEELCVFLNVPTDTMLARTDVTRMINGYIKKNNLQNPEARKNILPDENLTKLLRLQPEDQLSYFNLQKYMKHLFVSQK